MQTPAHADNTAKPLEPQDINHLYRNVEFDFLDAFLFDLNPRLSTLQEVLLSLIVNISRDERKKQGNKNPVCRLSLKQYQKLAAPRMPNGKVSIVGVRKALKALQQRGLILKDGTWRGRNVFIPIDPPQSTKKYAGIKVPIEAVADPTIHRAGKRMFGRIEYMLRDEKRIYIDWSNKRLADDLGLSELLVDKALRELRRENYIIISNGGSKFRQIGLHPEWKSLHAHLAEGFKRERLVGMIEEKANSRKIMRRLKKKGVVIRQEGSRGEATVVLPGEGGDTFEGSRNERGDTFEGGRVILSKEVGNQEHAETIPKNSDFQAPNKNKIIKKGLEDKKFKPKGLMASADAEAEDPKTLTSQERTSLMEKRDACQSKTPDNREKMPAHLKEFLAAKKLTMLWADLEDSGHAPWKLKVDSAPRVKRFFGQWLDGDLNPFSTRFPTAPRELPDPPPEDYISAADFL